MNSNDATSDSPASPRFGIELGGWRSRALIGAGGMADVYLAENAAGDRAALKVIRSQGMTATSRRLFDRECALLERLDHPNIVRLWEHGQTEDRLWIALQYVAGASAATLRSRRPELLTPEIVATIVKDVADALDYAHALNVVHRDVKPSNILVTIAPDGSVERAVLSDFGIAKAIESGDATYTNAITGTLGYAAPELLRNLPPVPASDQYSLACTVFSLLTDRPPFLADSIAAQVHAQLNTAPPRASSLAAVPREIDNVLIRAMERNPADRYPSCSAFAAALSAATGIDGPEPSDTDNRPDRSLYEDTIPPAPSASKGRRRTVLTVGTIAIAVACGVAAFFVRPTEPTSQSPSLQAYANNLCSIVQLDGPEAPFDTVSNGSTGASTVTDDVVGRGCRFTGKPARSTASTTYVIGYSENRPAPVKDTGDQALPSGYVGTLAGPDGATCVAGYHTEVGYLSLRAPAYSAACDDLESTMKRLNESGLVSKAR